MELNAAAIYAERGAPGHGRRTIYSKLHPKRSSGGSHLAMVLTFWDIVGYVPNHTLSGVEEFAA
jgi:hypothetical protein